MENSWEGREPWEKNPQADLSLVTIDEMIDEMVRRTESSGLRFLFLACRPPQTAEGLAAEKEHPGGVEFAYQSCGLESDVFLLKSYGDRTGLFQIDEDGEGERWI